MDAFKIGKVRVGKKAKSFIIAEIAQNHDGSLGQAHAYIDAVAQAGVDAVKFQTHIASEESSREETFRVPFSYVDKTRYAYWKRMEFSQGQWAGLKKHAVEKGLIFLSSPFSLKAAQLLHHLGCPAWKVGSGETNNAALLDFMIKTKKPILLSTGMSAYSEIDQAVGRILRSGSPLALFQCTTKYPTPFRDVGLNVLGKLASRYHVPFGLSDHSGSIFPSLFAMALEASFIEIHVAFHKGQFGPDISASITMDDLAILVRGARVLNLINRHPVDKDRKAMDLIETKKMFEKSIGTARELKKGTVLRKALLKELKPGTGIPAKDLADIIGKKLRRDLGKNEILHWKDIS